MRFGLSDLGELPSLKEFEALAREALGTDEGVAINGEVASGEGLVASEENAVVDAPSSRPSDSANSQEEAKELVADEVSATNEGMPAGDVDEAPKAAAAGE